MAKKQARRKVKKEEKMLFGPSNYKLLISGLVLIFVGFLAMYIENQVKGFVSLYISPFLILGGFTIIVFAIMKPRDDQQDSSNTATHGT